MANNPGAAQFEANSFASAVARAKQIAARITPASGDAQVQGIKRPLDSDASFGEPEVKKVAGDSTIGAQLRAISENQGFPSQATTEAARQAHEAAARVIANRQLGGGNQQESIMPGPMGGPGGMVVTEEFSIPDKMVGLVIGKGGEQITRLQADTGVKVQIAPDSGGMPNRPCTLTGPQQAIDMCKQAINQIIERGQTNGVPNLGGIDTMGENVKTIEMSIPGPKVGLIIGKGGETIRQLQESAGVKMVMIQDNNAPTTHDKPLKITGDQMKVQRARDMILNLLAEKEDMPRPGGGFNDYGTPNMGGMNNSMGGPSGGGMDIGVPRQGVGLVIGKGGDMIKKIQTETGAKVQFKPDDQTLPDRTCSIQGSPDKCQAAIAMINNLLAKANIPNPGYQTEGWNAMNEGTTMRNSSRPDMGQGGPGPYGNGGPRGGGMNNRFDGNMFDQHAYTVPAEKCGLVIGKGGETIREINRVSGAHVELDRNPPPNMNEKVFNIRGNPSQIQHAISLIQEKTGQHGGHNDQGPGPGPGAPGMMGGPGGPNGPPGGPGPQGCPNGPGPQGPGYDQYGGQFNQPNQPPQQPYGGAPQGWNAYGNQFPQQQSMANKQTNDANAAAWAYYYATYGQGQPGQQPATPQQPAAPQQQPVQQQQSAQPAYTPTINPQTHQPDYTEAWLNYYRCQGMWQEASMVLQHSQNQAAAAAGAASAISQGQQPGQP